MLVLGTKHLDSLMSMEDVIDAVEDGFKDYTLGKYTLPLRTRVSIKEGKASFLFMPAFTDDRDSTGVKIFVRSGKGVWALMGIFIGQGEKNSEGQEDKPAALMSGSWVTAMRTGAASGVASKYLAREDSKVVGMFGAGNQARTQLMAVACVRDIEEVRVYDPNTSTSSTFCTDMKKKLDIKITQAKTPKEAVKGCDIISTATYSLTPVFEGKWLEEGTHINGIGSHHGPGRKELDATTIKASKLVVDQREACLKEAADIMEPIADGVITKDHIYAELGELIIGQKDGRTNDKEITVFKSVGIAVQDIATALRAYELAKVKGIGVEIPDF